jgi:translocation protein SEC66
MASFSASAIAIAYLILVLGSLTIFSTVYRRRKAAESSKVEPWFKDHHARDIYLTLLHLDTPCPPKLLKAALLERAKEDISRIYSLREQKTAGTQLLQKGSIAEETYQQIVAAETDLNAEIADVMAEARALGGDEWGQTILQQANEYYQKTVILKTIERSKTFAEEEKKKWEEDEALRKVLQDEQRESALKELMGEETKISSGVQNGDAKLATKMIDGVEGQIPNGIEGEGLTERKGKKKNKKK